MQRSPIRTRQRTRITSSTPFTNRRQPNYIDEEGDDTFLNSRASQATNFSDTQIDLQTPPSQTNEMEIESISLSGVLNDTIEGTSAKLYAIHIGTDTETTTESDKPKFYHEAKQLKAYLTIIAKASNHKTFMEICLSKKEAPKNMIPRIQPHIYHSNETTESLWRQTLKQTSLN